MTAPTWPISGAKRLVDVTLSLNTNIYAANEVLAATQEVADCFRAADEAGFLESLTVICVDDLSVDFTVYFFDDNVVLGTENELPSISDADAAKVLAKVSVAAADYTDLGGVRIATLGNLRRVVRPKVGTTSLYLAVQNGAGTPTLTAAGIILRLGMELD